MNNLIKTVLLAGMGFALTASTALSAPILRGDVVVSNSIVTVGDMFEDADMLAEKPLFRAPKPGTSGRVSIEAIKTAAAKIGLSQFENPGVIAVEVSRNGTLIDENLVGASIVDYLTTQGVVTQGVSVDITFSPALPEIFAETGSEALQLVSLNYTPGVGRFSGRVLVAGKPKALSISGRADLYIEMPHLVSSAPAGKVLSPLDVEMRRVQLRFAQSSGMPELDQVVGKQLRRPARAGMMLRSADLTEPEIISRNDAVTVYLRNGLLTLTVKGQALNSASYGEKVSVLNALSNKVINGIAIDAGTVEIGTRPLSNSTL